MCGACRAPCRASPAAAGVRGLSVNSTDPPHLPARLSASSPRRRPLAAVNTNWPLSPPARTAIQGLGRAAIRGCNSRAADATSAGARRSSGRLLWWMLACRGRKYWGVVTTRSHSSRGAQGRPMCTRRVRPAERCLIQRATGSLRRPALITRSGHGGARALEAARSMPASVGRSPRCASSSQGRAMTSFSSKPNPSSSASARTWVLSPAFLPSRHQTRGVRSLTFSPNIAKPRRLSAHTPAVNYHTNPRWEYSA